MELYDIQETLRDLETSGHNINYSITKVLRFAQQRLDIEELLFCKLIKIQLIENKIKVVNKEVKEIAIEKGLSNEEYKKLFSNVYHFNLEIRTCNWYDEKQKKIVREKVLPYSAGEMIIDLEQHQDLLNINKVPDGLAPLDIYFANEKKTTTRWCYP